jgi:hypothetical protein
MLTHVTSYLTCGSGCCNAGQRYGSERVLTVLSVVVFRRSSTPWLSVEDFRQVWCRRAHVLPVVTLLCFACWMECLLRMCSAPHPLCCVMWTHSHTNDRFPLLCNAWRLMFVLYVPCIETWLVRAWYNSGIRINPLKPSGNFTYDQV